MKVLAATGHGAPGWFHDEAHLRAAFAAVGMDIEPAHWMNIEPDGTPILLRTAWDYTQHPKRFEAWLDRIEATATPCLNPPSVLRWNMEKRYLLDLERDGHAIVPTHVLDAFDEQTAHATATAAGWHDAIVKPVVGGGAEGLVRLRDGRMEAHGTAGNAWASDAPLLPVGPCLVQPFLPAILDGEWSLFFFGGTYSHAILKRPAAGDIRVQEEHGGTTVAAEPPPSVLQAAQDIARDRPEATVCRVDGLVVEDRFLLMELELIEPELYFRYAHDAEVRLASAVAAVLT